MLLFFLHLHLFAENPHLEFLLSFAITSYIRDIKSTFHGFRGRHNGIRTILIAPRLTVVKYLVPYYGLLFGSSLGYLSMFG
jgi:hypothetical protein